ncbi:MAG: Trk system potassium transporter TrkA [Pyramidobacter sp.]|nr:Trk system potassium transporter TrkA [Pyramidobacter sp.]
MKIVVVGAGNVGCTVASSLAADGRDVIIIERDPEIAEKIENEQDVSVIRGNGARPTVLESAGVVPGGGVECLIACTDRDETNLMACWLAKRAGVPRVLSRVRDMEFTDTPAWAHELGIDVMASPERSLSREISSLLTFNAAVHSTEILGGRAGSFAFRVESDSPICGMSLREVGQKYPGFGAVMVYVERGEDGFVPSGDWVAQEGDLCFLVTLNERVPQVQRLFDAENNRTLSRVIIIGGGKLGANLARRLSDNFPRLEVTLVDNNMEKCERLAREYSSVQVVHGDGMDKRLLMQLGIDRADGLVAATADDEMNTIIASLASVLECRKTIAVVRNAVYDELEGALPVDVFLNPNVTLASTFLRHIRYPNTAGILSLIDRIGAEMLEFVLKDGNPVIGRRIMDLDLPKGILIAMIRRGSAYLVPGGGETLHSGDVISIFAMTELMPEAMRIFEAD